MYINRVEICGVDTAKLPVLREKEKTELLKRIKSGDISARDELINGNLRLVLSVVQRFASRGENLDDLFQIGCIGLIKAIDNFDINQNVKFSTYAVPMIIGEIRRYLRDNNAIRVSRSLRDTANRAFQIRNALATQRAQEPTVEEIAKQMDMPPEEVVFAMDAVQDPVSLSQPVYQDGGDALYIEDSIADERNSDERWLASIALRDAVERLSEREKNIIYLRYFEGKTQMEVAEEVHISQAQVSRLEKSAIKNIKKSYT